MHLCVGWESQEPAQHVTPDAAEQDLAESLLRAENKQSSPDAPLPRTDPHTAESQADASALLFTPAGLPKSKDRLSLSVAR